MHRRSRDAFQADENDHLPLPPELPDSAENGGEFRLIAPVDLQFDHDHIVSRIFVFQILAFSILIAVEMKR